MTNLIKVVSVVAVLIALFLVDGGSIIDKLNARNEMSYIMNDMVQLRSVGGDVVGHEAYEQYVNDSCMLESIYIQWPELR